MKCMSCEREIDPKWKHAIDTNLCPFCGLHIMEEKLKNLFSNLCAIMDDLSEKYQDQLNDWMISNHDYIKTDSPQITQYMPKEYLHELKKEEDDRKFQEKKKFTVKVQTDSGEEEVEVEKIQSDKTTNEFFKRAEVGRSKDGPAEKTQRLKEMVKQIKKTGSTSVNDAGTADIISPEMLEMADPDAVAEFQSQISGGEIASSLPDANDDEIPAVVMAMANKSKGNSSSSGADLLKLQQMQQRQQESRQNFESGNNRGKGGFSRT